MCLLAPRCTVGALRAAPDILIADDELLLRESLQDALEQVGYRVAVARHGLEALALSTGSRVPRWWCWISRCH